MAMRQGGAPPPGEHDGDAQESSFENVEAGAAEESGVDETAGAMGRSAEEDDDGYGMGPHPGAVASMGSMITCADAGAGAPYLVLKDARTSVYFGCQPVRLSSSGETLLVALPPAWLGEM